MEQDYTTPQVTKPLSGEIISHVLTRLSLALVFLSFGFVQLQSTSGWVSYLPELLQKLPLRPEFFIYLNATMEIALGTVLLLGTYIRFAAFILGVHLLGIAAMIGFNPTGIRDFGLSLATLGVALAGNDSFSLGKYFARDGLPPRGIRAVTLYVLTALIGLGSVAYATYAYVGFNIFHPDSSLLIQGLSKEAPASSITTKSGPKSPSNSSALTMSGVSAHASARDCWIIIKDRVYAVQDYIPFHPGGERRITDVCGKDATVAFATKGGAGGSHSQNAQTLLEKYYVGTLGSIVSDSTSNTTDSNPSPIAGTTTITPASRVVTPTPLTTPTPTSAPTSTFTLASVASHNSISDCWIIVSGSVYNVTAYIPFHPGGSNRITGVCGQDATTAFNTRGGTGSHSLYARSLLANYLLGTIGSTVTVTPTPISTVTPVPTVTPTPTVSDPKQPYRDVILLRYPGATITQLTIEDDGSAAFTMTYLGKKYEGTMNAHYQIIGVH